jgi:flavin-dependent dehydrogenase
VPDYFVDGVIYMCVSPSGYVGLVRQEDGSLNVAAALEPELVRRAGGLAALAGSVMHDAGGPSVPGLSNYHWQGTPLLTQRSRRVFGHRLFLVGDAAGYVEPLTGEGIAWALESAAAVAPLADRGIAAWSGELGLQWQAAYACVIERRQNICRWLARAAKYPSFFRAGMRVTEWFPSIADRLVKQLNAPTAIEKPRGAV